MQLRKTLKPVAYFAALTLAAAVNAAPRDTSTSRTTPDIHEAHGMAEIKPSLAIMGGVIDTEAGRGAGASYAVEYSMQPVVPFSTSLELGGFTGGKRDEVPGLTRTKLFGNFNYNFGGDIPVIKNSFAGIGLGPVYDNERNTGTLALGIAPRVGFDIPLSGTQYSLGANASYTFVSNARPDVFAVNGVAKYWF